MLISRSVPHYLNLDQIEQPNIPSLDPILQVWWKYVTIASEYMMHYFSSKFYSKLPNEKMIWLLIYKKCIKVTFFIPVCLIMLDQSNTKMHTIRAIICLPFFKEMIINWTHVDIELFTVNFVRVINWDINQWNSPVGLICVSIPSSLSINQSILLWFPVALLYWCIEPSEPFLCCL